MGVPLEGTNNVLAALVAWVENGTAPETVEGTKFVNDTVGMGVAFRRRHCRSDQIMSRISQLPQERCVCGLMLTSSSGIRCKTLISGVIRGYQAAGNASET